MYPPAIIYINSDLNQTVKDTLNTQLFLDEIITAEEFDARVVADPNYPNIIHLQALRILVIRDDSNNINLADVVLFFKYGLVAIEINNCGPHGLTLPISRLYVDELLRYNNSIYTINLPTQPPYPRKLYGIFVYGMDTSGVHAPNTDDEPHNYDFLYRK
jgi:hypothetical protein